MYNERVLVGKKEIATPANPDAGYALCYPKGDGFWYTKDSAGTERRLSNGTATDTIWDAKGDLAVATGADAASKLTADATDDMVLATLASETTGLKWKVRGSPVPHLPSGALAANWDRAAVGAQATPLTSGTLYLCQIWLPAGLVISSISFRSTGTAGAALTHQWFGIADISRVFKRFTGDDTTAAWGANNNKTLNLSSSWTTTYSGEHYVGIMVSGTTPPGLFNAAAAANLANVTPVLAGNTTDTGLTGVPGLPFTAGALTSSVNTPYCWVS